MLDLYATLSGELASGEFGSGPSGFVCPEQKFEQSLPLCIGLSALGGLLEVTSTMVLAYPEYKTKLGYTYTACQMRLRVLLNLVLMLIASVAYIVGSWFGPVSLAVPTVMISKLLFNLVIMGAVLRMVDFPREQRIGTYTIACAILTLPEIGAKDQKCQDALHLMNQLHSKVWGGVIALASLACVVGMVVLKFGPQPPPMGRAMAVYVTAQVTSAVVGASVSKMFVLADGLTLYILFGIAIAFAAVNVVSLILAAKDVDQALFIPMTTCFTLVTNMITGLIIWEDWRTISMWIAYLAVHLSMLLGVCLLAPADFLQQYRNTKLVEVSKEIYREGTLRNLPAIELRNSASGEPTLPQPSPRSVLRGEENPRTRLFEGSLSKSYGRFVPPPSREQAAAWKETLMLPEASGGDEERLIVPGATGGMPAGLSRIELMQMQAAQASGHVGAGGANVLALPPRGGDVAAQV